MSNYEEPFPVPLRIGNGTTNQYTGTNPHKPYGYRILVGLVQQLLGLCEIRAKGTVFDAFAIQIDFDKNCFRNHSLTSTECPFCPIGILCKQAKNEQKETVSITTEKTGTSNPKLREQIREDV